MVQFPLKQIQNFKAFWKMVPVIILNTKESPVLIFSYFSIFFSNGWAPLITKMDSIPD